jgi:hypothetical protein
MPNKWREYRYQVQQRDSAKLIAEYAADGVPEYANAEWSDRLKKPYPMKSAAKEYEHCVTYLAPAGLRDFRLIDTKTGNVIARTATTN